jgi:hypothetical protein
MPPWEVEFTNEFEEWFDILTEDQQEAVTNRVDMLAESGPGLGRPYVDTIVGSRLANLKELRCAQQGALRILFVFDPRRTAILLLGGDKTGQWKVWYEIAIPLAEALYETYLKELRAEGLL